ncbi:MAG: MotA/TolQ/ExbB proton channel family protein [Kiritimatiellia bacterium]
MKIFSYMAMGGPVGWVILTFGFVAFCVFIERALSLHRARIDYSDFLRGIFNCIRQVRPQNAHITEALTLCDETPGPVAYLVKMAITCRDASVYDLDRTLQDTASAEISRMERRLAVLALIAQIAPLFGLFGTILGILDGVLVFQSQGPLIQSANLMDGLLLALTSTALGLGVAIPCYAAFNVLVIKVDRIVLDMERTRYEIVAFLKGEYTREEVRS